MKKEAIHLSIPTPCHEKWGEMSPAEKGRFCNQCSKTVIDFTTMSDGEIIQTIRKNNAAICGRFLNSQMSRPITHYSGRSFNTYLPLTHLLVGFFLFSSPALVFTQTHMSPTEIPQVEVIETIKGDVYVDERPRLNQNIIEGYLVDSTTNEILSYESIRLETVNGKIVSITQADENGYFRIEVPATFKDSNLYLNTLISSRFESKRIQIDCTKDLPWKQTIRLNPKFENMILGMVLIDEKTIKKDKREKKE